MEAVDSFPLTSKGHKRNNSNGTTALAPTPSVVALLDADYLSGLPESERDKEREAEHNHAAVLRSRPLPLDAANLPPSPFAGVTKGEGWLYISSSPLSVYVPHSSSSSVSAAMTNVSLYGKWRRYYFKLHPEKLELAYYNDAEVRVRVCVFLRINSSSHATFFLSFFLFLTAILSSFFSRVGLRTRSHATKYNLCVLVLARET